MSPATRRLTGLVAVVVLLAMVAGGIGATLHHGGSTTADDAGPAPVAPTGGPAPTTPPTPDLSRFYHQHIDWKTCGDNRCGTLLVPLDYRKPGGRTIELNLLERPADGHAIGSLVINPGGPGEPGTSFAAAGSQVFGTPLLDHYDIVGFDPRGTGHSDPVDCVSDAELTRYLAEDPDPSTKAEIAAWKRSQQALATGCLRHSGALADHISTVESAKDMDVLRAALGERRLTYLGFSYGTELGSVYATLFPQRVGRFVLDGAVDTELSPEQLDLQQAQGFQRALASYVSSCVHSQTGCFLGKTDAAAMATISQLVTRIAAKPLSAGDGRVLTQGSAFTGIALTLYNKSYWLLLTTALRAALGGDGSQLMTLADAYASRNADGTYTDNSMEAFYAISCLDDPSSIPYAQVPDHYPAFEKAAPLFGRTFAWGLASCRGFTAHSSYSIPKIHAPGAQPIVIVGTTRDPATPYSWAVALSHQLSSSVLVTRNGDGHTGYHAGNPCVDTAVEGYLVSGTVPRRGLHC